MKTESHKKSSIHPQIHPIMKNTSLLLSFAFVASYGFAQTKEIHFEKTTFAEIKAKAKKENKLIFIDAYTSWCGPCKWMAKEVFTNDTVADYFNSKFVNAKFDMEKGEGVEMAKTYSVQCYPNLLFIDGDGKLVHRGAGGQPAQSFIKLAEEAFNPEKRYSKYTEQYASKKSDPAFLLDYMAIMDRSCMPADDVLKDYFSTQKEEALTNRTNWGAIRDYANDPKSREFSYLLKNIDTYKKLYTEDSVESKVNQVLMQGGYRAFYKKGATEKDYTDYIEELKKFNYAGTEEITFFLGLAYNEMVQDWAKYSKLAASQGDKFLKEPNEINNIAWALYEHSDDKEALSKADKWMQKAIVELPEWHLYDTHAAVLYKLQKKSEAKAAAKKAIEIAEKNGTPKEDYDGTIELLKKIEKL
jgi:thiol-disulfide isomerase/thioredoxin